MAAYAEDRKSLEKRAVVQRGNNGVVNSYTFMLTFSLPARGADPSQYLDALYEAGCDDASVGIGQHGVIGLDFTRSASSAEEALCSAIRSAQTAIPGAILVQAGPDLVGL